jgi:exosome complex RNA-binding protein Rrp42 (RNase PH superfamily)
VYADCRIDGRRNDEFRKYHFEITTTTSASSSILPTSHGSSRLIDPTTGWQLITSIKAELVTPAPDRPTRGIMEIQIDEHNKSNNIHRQYWKDIQNALQEHIVKSILESPLLNPTASSPSSLCVLPGIAVWKLNIDLWSVGNTNTSSQGQLLDAASHAIRNTLPYTYLPTIRVPTNDTTDSMGTKSDWTLDQLLVDADIRNARPVLSYHIHNPLPLIVTVTILRHQQHTQYLLVQDATSAEEFCSIAQVHVAIVPSSSSSDATTVQAVWKTGTGTIPMTLFPKIVQAAIQAVPHAIDQYQAVVFAAPHHQQSSQHPANSLSSHRTNQKSETTASSSSSSSSPFLQAPIIIQ